MLRTCSSRRAITLIEVLAGITLMATLFTMMVVAAGRHTARIADAQRELQALEALDQLLAEWYSSDNALPTDDEGPLINHADWVWRKSVRALPDHPRKWRARVLQVEVWTPGISHPLASVQLLDEDPTRPPSSLRGQGGSPNALPLTMEGA